MLILINIVVHSLLALVGILFTVAAVNFGVSRGTLVKFVDFVLLLVLIELALFVVVVVKLIVVLILRWFVYTVFFSIHDTARLKRFLFPDQSIILFLVRLYLFGHVLIALLDFGILNVAHFNIQPKPLVLFLYLLYLRLLDEFLDVSLRLVPAHALLVALSFDFLELIIICLGLSI